MSAIIQAVHLSAKHGFSKQPQASVTLLAGQGVEGDAHCGETVQHVYLKRRNPAAPNLMQVHLLQAELFDDLAALGFSVQPGQIGENLTTRGIDLLSLPLGTRLHVGSEAVVELTGLRTPCSQIDRFQSGLMRQMVLPRVQGRGAARAGVMSIVLQSGVVRAGDALRAELPCDAHRPLQLL